MNKKPILGLLLAVISVVLLVTLVSAASPSVDGFRVEIDGVRSDDTRNVAVFAGDTVPVEVLLVSDSNSEGPLEVSAWIQGAKSQTEVEQTLNVDLVDGSRYNVKFSMYIPSDLDDDELTRNELTLVMRFETEEGSFEKTRTLYAQREANKLSFLLVDFDSSVRSGTSLPVSVVLTNTGSHKADDTFVTVSIPELGVSKTAFLSDLYPVENCDDDDVTLCEDKHEDNEDTLERMVFVTIPDNAAEGVYEVKVTATSDDARSTVVAPLTIMGDLVEGTALANPTSQTFSLGERAVYELVLVNTGDNIAIYSLVPEASDALNVGLSNTLVTVPAGTSKTVKVFVKADREGTYNFAVSAVSEEFTQTAVYSATVEGRSFGGSDNNAVVMTVVLAIIFVVLLIVLIVLLTRRPEKSEEFGESYY